MRATLSGDAAKGRVFPISVALVTTARKVSEIGIISIMKHFCIKDTDHSQQRSTPGSP